MLDVRSFLDELKRRKVVRTAVAYAIAVGGILSVAEIVWQHLPLPSGTMTVLVVLAIIGLPVVLAFEWVFEITREGVRRTTEPDAAAERKSLTRPIAFGVLPLPFLLGAMVVLVAGIGAWFLWLRDPDGGIADSPLDDSAVVILPFEIRGSADLAYLREGMVDLLATKLGGTEVLQPRDSRAVLAFLDHEGLNPLEPAVPGRVARRFGAGRVLQGSVVGHEGAVQIRASLYRIGEDEPEVEAAAEGDDDDLFLLVDDLAARVLAGSDAAARLTRLAALTTESLTALKAYIGGEHAYRQGRWGEAIGAYSEAVEIDSTFALAYYRLANAAAWAEARHIAEPAARTAARLSERLRSRDRRLVEALAARLRGDHAEAIRMGRESVALYPDDIEAWYELGEVLFHEGYLSGQDPEDAVEAFQKAAELDPESVPALHHLVYGAAMRGRGPRLDSLTDRLLTLTPGADFFRALHVLHRGDDSARDSILVELHTARPGNLWLHTSVAPTPAVGERVAILLTDSRHPTGWPAVGVALKASAQADGGRWRAALESLEELADLDRALALEYRGYLTLVAHPGPGGGELESLHAALRAWDPAGSDPAGAVPSSRSPHVGLHPYLRLYLLGLVEARLGQITQALARAEDLAEADAPPEYREYLQDLSVIVRSEAARAVEGPRRALEILGNAPLWTTHPLDERRSPLVGHYYPVFLRGELLRETGRFREALRWYRPFEIVVQVPPATLALRRRAEIVRSLGDEAGARELDRRVRLRWADADSAFERVLTTPPPQADGVPPMADRYP